VRIKAKARHTNRVTDFLHATYEVTEEIHPQYCASPAREIKAGDPFDTACVPLDKTVAGLLHYYVHYYHPVTWPNEMVVIKHGFYVFHDTMKANLRMVVANKVAMYCLLSAAACRMQYIDCLPCAQAASHETEYFYHALHLMGQQIQLLSMDSWPARRQLLVCMMFLISAESYRDNVAAAKMHVTAVSDLLKPLGGMASIEDEALRKQISMGDLYTACVRLEPCLFEPIYDPGPPRSLQLLSRELHTDECFTSRCNSLCGNSWLPAALRSQIEQLAESYSIKCRLILENMPGRRALSVTHWITTRNMAIRNRALSLQLDNPAHHAVRATVIMWSLLTMNVTGRTKTIKVMAPLLKTILQGATSTDWADGVKIQLWVLIVGFHCSTEGSETAQWFADRVWKSWRCLVSPASLSRKCARNETELASRLEQFQLDFFFDEKIQRPRTRSLAKVILQK
jgi:hypothetical protein